MLQFRRTCLEGAESNDPSDKFYIETLGRLMNDSQQSCSQSFECSCPELDELTRLARLAGAYGSRLTGAGWGGCTVSLVAEDKVDRFIRQIQRTYQPYRHLDNDALQDAIFATKPGNGASGKHLSIQSNCCMKISDQLLFPGLVYKMDS